MQEKNLNLHKMYKNAKIQGFSPVLTYAIRKKNKKTYVKGIDFRKSVYYTHLRKT